MNTYTSPQDGSTLDSYTDSYTSNTNYGSETLLNIGNPASSANPRLRVWISFPGINNGDVPPSSSILTATLHLYMTANDASASTTMSVYRCRRSDVSESQITHNVYKTGSNWGTAGMENTSTDREADAIGSITLAAAEATGWKTVTLDKDKVKQMVDGTWATNSFVMRCTETSDDGHSFASSENATTANRPYIVIEYNKGNAGCQTII